MSSLGFVEQLLDGSDWFYQVALKQFAWWKQVQGTKCIVNRINAKEEKYYDVFGSVYSSTVKDDDNVEVFNYVILISMNDMKKIFQKSIDQLQFYDNEDKLKLGDIIIFSRKKQEYKFKIIDIQSHGEAQQVLNQYTIAGMTEVNSIE